MRLEEERQSVKPERELRVHACKDIDGGAESWPWLVTFVGEEVEVQRSAPEGGEVTLKT